MVVQAEIRDARGSRNGVLVGDDGALFVQQRSIPYFGPQLVKPFRAYLTTSAGSSDMLVDGSTTNVDFTVDADPKNDRYITVLSFVIADTGTFAQNEFGNLGAALTNGCSLFYDRLDETVVIHDTLKANFDFIRLALGRPAFGQQSNAFRGTNFVGTAEAIMPIVDLKEFIPPFGFKLDAGSTQKLTFRIRDDCSGIVAFDCIAYGFDRFPDE